MLETLKDLPPGIEGLKAIGKICKEDYEQTFEPLLNEARREGRRLRFLYHLGPEFEGFTPGGAWEDAKIGLRSMQLFDGCAIVSDNGWLRESARLIAFLMPCPVRAFGDQDRAKAIEWLRSLPEGAAMSHRLIAETGVIVVEVKEALRAQDFDALAATADAWIETHGDLQGIVIHVSEFPGLGESRELAPTRPFRPRPSPEAQARRTGHGQQTGYPGTARRGAVRPGRGEAVWIRRARRRHHVGGASQRLTRVS